MLALFGESSFVEGPLQTLTTKVGPDQLSPWNCFQLLLTFAGALLVFCVVWVTKESAPPSPPRLHPINLSF